MSRREQGSIHHKETDSIVSAPRDLGRLYSDLKPAVPVVPVFTEEFTSSGQTITAAGALIIAHSLSAEPTLIQCRLKCTTANLGYSIDDEVIVNPHGNATGSATSRGISIVPDATNLNVRYGSSGGVFSLIRKDTGASASITTTSWEFIVKAWV